MSRFRSFALGRVSLDRIKHPIAIAYFSSTVVLMSTSSMPGTEWTIFIDHLPQMHSSEGVAFHFLMSPVRLRFTDGGFCLA